LDVSFRKNLYSLRNIRSTKHLHGEVSGGSEDKAMAHTHLIASPVEPASDLTRDDF